MIPIALIMMMLLVSPVVIDAVAQPMPDSPLYGVAHIGEQMQVASGLMTNSQVAEQRIYEYAYMAKKTGSDPQQLLTANGVALNAAQAKNEMGYGESVAYTGAVLDYVSQSTEYPASAKQTASSLSQSRGYGESGFVIAEGGIPFYPAECEWETSVLPRCKTTGATQIVNGVTYYDVCCNGIRPPRRPPIEC